MRSVVTNTHTDESGRLFVAIDKVRFYLAPESLVSEFEWVDVGAASAAGGHVAVREYLPRGEWWVPSAGRLICPAKRDSFPAVLEAPDGRRRGVLS